MAVGVRAVGRNVNRGRRCCPHVRLAASKAVCLDAPAPARPKPPPTTRSSRAMSFGDTIPDSSFILCPRNTSPKYLGAPNPTVRPERSRGIRRAKPRRPEVGQNAGRLGLARRVRVESAVVSPPSTTRLRSGHASLGPNGIEVCVRARPATPSSPPPKKRASQPARPSLNRIPPPISSPVGSQGIGAAPSLRHPAGLPRPAPSIRPRSGTRACRSAIRSASRSGRSASPA